MREYLFSGKRKVCIVSPINDQGTTGGNAGNPYFNKLKAFMGEIFQWR